jgi:hypothetical protein
MGLLELAEAGVADLLEKGAEVIAEKGLAKGLRINLRDGSVDPVAALALAAGASLKTVHNSSSIFDLGVPAVREVPLILAVEALEAILNQDLEEWSDSNQITTEDVRSLFWRTSILIRIAIT